MKLELIAPKKKPEQGYDFWDMRISSAFAGRKYGQVPIALSTLAALTPADVEVGITDENIEPIDFNKQVDIVGITCNTPLAPRAYEIADRFRESGVTVIIGGIHASMLPQEAIQHADSVVIGEAENIWEGLVNDFREDRLQKFYHDLGKPDLRNAPIPCWDLLKSDLYNCQTVQAGRGCSFDCEFCSVTAFSGRGYRFKPIENVVKEIQFLQQIESKRLIVFVDDNIVSNRRYARELFTALIPLNIYWFGQASVNVANDEDLLELMAKSGCKQVFVGFESLSEQNLELMNKSKVNKAEEYAPAIERLHHYGISVFGALILGNDFDDETVFERTVKFVTDTNLEFVQISILTPFPGTRLFQRLEREGRILHKDWERYTGASVCFKPRLMSPEALENGFRWVWQQVYSYDAVYKRLSRLWDQNILARGAKIGLMNRGILAFRGLHTLDISGFCYMLRSLWHTKGPYLSFIFTSIDLHDCAYSFPKVATLDTLHAIEEKG